MPADGAGRWLALHASRTRVSFEPRRRGAGGGGAGGGAGGSAGAAGGAAGEALLSVAVSDNAAAAPAARGTGAGAGSGGAAADSAAAAHALLQHALGALAAAWGDGMPAESQPLPTGSVLGFIHVCACVSPAQCPDDPQALGPVCWIIDKVLELDAPVPCAGSRGQWKLPHDLPIAVPQDVLRECGCAEQAAAAGSPAAHYAGGGGGGVTL